MTRYTPKTMPCQASWHLYGYRFTTQNSHSTGRGHCAIKPKHFRRLKILAQLENACFAQPTQAIFRVTT